MTKLLRAEGYRVVGTSRDGATTTAGLITHRWDLRDQSQLDDILRRERPDELYNFAAYSSGAAMFDAPVDIGDINGLAVGRILESIRAVDPSIRFCQASSSEVFGNASETPQRETTACRPRTPYGAAKLYAQTMIAIYRARYGLFATSAILFNHESPLRGRQFVTRKVSHAAASAKLGRLTAVTLGNLDARRDWGHAQDTVVAMWRMLQVADPDDYVVGTGVTHSVRDLCACAFSHVGLDYRDFVVEDREAFRVPETVQLVGDASKAARDLDWRPTVDFKTMVQEMVDADFRALNTDCL